MRFRVNRVRGPAVSRRFVDLSHTREGSLAADVREHLQGRRKAMREQEFLTIVVPELLEPFRDIGYSLTHYVRRFRPDGVNRMVTVVIPEFVVSKLRHQLLHGQTALIVKRHLLFEPGVVVASVPYHLEN